jgi:hypothetical protein
LEIPFWRLTIVAPFLALRPISLAAASVPVLLAVSRTMSASLSAAGFVEKAICSGGSRLRQPEKSVRVRPSSLIAAPIASRPT